MKIKNLENLLFRSIVICGFSLLTFAGCSDEEPPPTRLAVGQVEVIWNPAFEGERGGIFPFKLETSNSLTEKDIISVARADKNLNFYYGKKVKRQPETVVFSRSGGEKIEVAVQWNNDGRFFSVEEEKFPFISLLAAESHGSAMVNLTEIDDAITPTN